ncbi:MAG: hypothetical protein EXR70_01225 [Deltaproteobacteria bacterium]|nr:hypothetical protein [Deltaproteobacteria bacterium]
MRPRVLAFQMAGVFLLVSLASFAAEKTPATTPAKAPATAAMQNSQPKKSKSGKTPKALKYRGDISAIDAASGAVSVKGLAGEKQFMTQDAAKDAVERLSVGDNVRVIYSDKEGKLLATSVRRLKVKQTKASSSTPTKAADSKTTAPQKNSQAAGK